MLRNYIFQSVETDIEIEFEICPKVPLGKCPVTPSIFQQGARVPKLLQESVQSTGRVANCGGGSERDSEAGFQERVQRMIPEEGKIGDVRWYGAFWMPKESLIRFVTS